MKGGEGKRGSEVPELLKPDSPSPCRRCRKIWRKCFWFYSNRRTRQLLTSGPRFLFEPKRLGQIHPGRRPVECFHARHANYTAILFRFMLVSFSWDHVGAETHRKSESSKSPWLEPWLKQAHRFSMRQKLSSLAASAAYQLTQNIQLQHADTRYALCTVYE